MKYQDNRNLAFSLPIGDGEKQKKQRTMKNIKNNIGIIVFVLAISVTLLVSPQAMTQIPPPPNNGTTSSGGAPIGGGIMTLATIGLAYGYAKFISVVVVFLVLMSE